LTAAVSDENSFYISRDSFLTRYEGYLRHAGDVLDSGDHLLHEREDPLECCSIFPVAEKMFSRSATILCVSQIKVAKTRKMVGEAKKMFFASEKIFFIIEKTFCAPLRPSSQKRRPSSLRLRRSSKTQRRSAKSRRRSS
jgi:hypothetical protein